MNKSILANKTAYKLFLVCAKFSSYIYALAQLAGLICVALGFTTAIPALIGGCSLITIILLYLISIVFQFCTTHRIPLYYVMSVYAIGVLDFIFPFGSNLELLRIYFVNAGIFILMYIYIWYKYRNITKIDEVKHFCERYCNC